ncbi:hypothetical protein Tco_1541352 [Tanacetum coccineum]
MIGASLFSLAFLESENAMRAMFALYFFSAHVTPNQADKTTSIAHMPFSEHLQSLLPFDELLDSIYVVFNSLVNGDLHKKTKTKSKSDKKNRTQDAQKCVDNATITLIVIRARANSAVVVSLMEFVLVIKHAQSEEVQELLSKLVQDVKIISDELSEYINTPAWNRPLVYCDDDDDEDYTIAIHTRHHQTKEAQIASTKIRAKSSHFQIDSSPKFKCSFQLSSPLISSFPKSIPPEIEVLNLTSEGELDLFLADDGINTNRIARIVKTLSFVIHQEFHILQASIGNPIS